jgi:hypothetical protein
MRLTAELLTRHVLSPRLTHSAIGSESCNVREMFTAPYPVVVFSPSLNALRIITRITYYENADREKRRKSNSRPSGL